MLIYSFIIACFAVVSYLALYNGLRDACERSSIIRVIDRRTRVHENYLESAVVAEFLSIIREDSRPAKTSLNQGRHGSRRRTDDTEDPDDRRDQCRKVQVGDGFSLAHVYFRN